MELDKENLIKHIEAVGELAKLELQGIECPICHKQVNSLDYHFLCDHGTGKDKNENSRKEF